MTDLIERTERGVKRSREGLFGRIADLFSRLRIEDSTWDELEELLITADVGVETTDKLLSEVRKRVKNEKLAESSQVSDALKAEMKRLLSVAPDATITNPADSMKIILVVGVNGTGKTTSIAKLANEYKNRGQKVLLGAADTFRAAAADQLKMWGERVGVDIAHQPGADPGAVVFDTLEAARSRRADVVIIDTAGRLQTKHNLMDELKKIKKVAAKYQADMDVLLVIDATTGQNGLSQASSFTEATDVTGIFLTKLDGTAKGGIVFAICDALRIPIKYIGTGEKIDDIAPFDAGLFVDAIFSKAV
jgi:fused signal recognition particle receptor